MVFQKKIIIGSVMSFIATAVGVIAVFFPDLLNLQKKKMESLELTIETTEQFDRLSKFITEREKDKKIFQLNLEICENLYSEDDFNIIKENNGIAFAYMNEYFNEEPTLTKFDMNAVNLVIQDHGEDEINSSCQSGWCSGISYIFPTIDILPINKETNCSSRGMIGVQIIKGYFVHKDTQYTKGAHEYHSFQEIPKENVILKDY